MKQWRQRPQRLHKGPSSIRIRSGIWGEQLNVPHL